MDPWAPADPLAETLGVLRMNGAYYCRSELTAPWGMALFAMPGYLWFHVVVSGRILLETDGSPGVWLEAGDLALVPRGTGHRLRSEAGAAAPDILELGLERVSDRYEVLRHGGGGAPTTLVCGAVRFEHPAARRLVEVLPDVIRVAASDPLQADWTQATLRLMAAEARELRPGGEAAMTRLADVLVIQALRAWLDADPAARTGWLGALRDPDLGGAIAAVHRDPARAWSVARARPRRRDVALRLRGPLRRARRASRRCSTSRGCGCSSPTTRSAPSAPPRASSQAASATAPKRRSHVPSSARWASRRAPSSAHSHRRLEGQDQPEAAPGRGSEMRAYGGSPSASTPAPWRIAVGSTG